MGVNIMRKFLIILLLFCNLITSSLSKEIRKLSEKLDHWMEKQNDQEIVIYSPYPITEELPDKKKIEFLNKEAKSLIK